MLYFKFLQNVMLTTEVLLLAGCNSSSPTEENLSILSSSLTRNLAPKANNNELQALAENNNKFAFTIFDKLYKNEKGNIFFSPYSISEALAIVYAGAKGDTKTEIASVFNFNTDDDNLHESFNALDLHLKSEDENYIFNPNNAIWIQKNYPILEGYLNTIKVNYGANIKVLDFVNKTEESRVIINKWVKKETNQRITEIIPEGGVNQATPIVITNTVYFAGEWLKKFDKSYTKNDTFTAEDGFSKQTPFMKQYDWNYKYLQESYYQAIELPYKGEKSSMLIVLPDENEYINTIDNIESIYQNIKDMSYSNIILKMPKFEFSTPLYDIKEYLKTLGMIAPFYGSADFSNMTSDNSLFIGSISHKAFIMIDEEGTEAAAATVVVDINISLPDNVITFDINRGFIIFIKDDNTNQILFIGTIVDI